MFKLQKDQPVLMVEDNDDDFEATVRALKASGFEIENRLIRFDNGDDALSYLRREGEYQDAAKYPRPGVILLDLNMPGMSGQDILSEIKTNETLREIPVVILTTSNNEKDVSSCYAAGANTYVQKPVNIDHFFEAIKKLTEYWFDLAVLPKEPPQLETLTTKNNLFKF